MSDSAEASRKRRRDASDEDTASAEEDLETTLSSSASDTSEGDAQTSGQDNLVQRQQPPPQRGAVPMQQDDSDDDAVAAMAGAKAKKRRRVRPKPQKRPRLGKDEDPAAEDADEVNAHELERSRGRKRAQTPRRHQAQQRRDADMADHGHEQALTRDIVNAFTASLAQQQHQFSEVMRAQFEAHTVALAAISNNNATGVGGARAAASQSSGSIGNSARRTEPPPLPDYMPMLPLTVDANDVNLPGWPPHQRIPRTGLTELANLRGVPPDEGLMAPQLATLPTLTHNERVFVHIHQLLHFAGPKYVQLAANTPVQTNTGLAGLVPNGSILEHTPEGVGWQCVYETTSHCLLQLSAVMTHMLYCVSNPAAPLDATWIAELLLSAYRRTLSLVSGIEEAVSNKASPFGEEVAAFANQFRGTAKATMVQQAAKELVEVKKTRAAMASSRGERRERDPPHRSSEPPPHRSNSRGRSGSTRGYRGRDRERERRDQRDGFFRDRTDRPYSRERPRRTSPERAPPANGGKGAGAGRSGQ